MCLKVSGQFSYKVSTSSSDFDIFEVLNHHKKHSIPHLENFLLVELWMLTILFSPFVHSVLKM